MQVQIQSIHFEASKSLEQFVNARLEKLHHLNERIVNVDVYLKQESVQHTAIDKTAELKLSLAGQKLFAQATAKSFEEAIDISIEGMRKQLVRLKEKAPHVRVEVAVSDDDVDSI